MLGAFVKRMSGILLSDPRPTALTPEDPLPFFLKQGTLADVFSFSHMNISGALCASEPLSALNRFSIDSITLLKCGKSPSNDVLLCVDVSDTLHPSSDNHRQLVITREPLDGPSPQCFSEHTASPNVLDAILSAVADSLEVVSPSASLMSAQSNSASQLTVVNTAASSPPCFLVPTIVRVWDSRRAYRRSHIVRQIKPTNLKLFELALLAFIVYNHGHLYSLFKKQSYWYATLICDAVLALSPCKQQDARGTTYCQDEVYIPPNVRFPKLAGQWMRIPVGDVEAAVLSIVLPSFEEARTQNVNEVRLCIVPGFNAY